MYGLLCALSAIAQNFRSHTDQLLITGSEPPSLEILFEQAQAAVRASKKPAAYSVFTVIRPCEYLTPCVLIYNVSDTSRSFVSRYPTLS
jgi:hypothetical protein